MKVIKIDRETADKAFKKAKLRIIKDARASKNKYGRPSEELMSTPNTE